ncbi:MAG TPA: S8 family serine peptidase [Vicinamibacterales bacterium]|nr:S8 family serine peptidase [Vicinamibacterales bacterium]
MSFPLRVKTLCVAVCLSTTVSGQSALPSISGDLLTLVNSGSIEPIRVIVRGDVAAIRAAAARDGLPVARVLDGFVVVEGRPAQIDALRHVAGVAGLSRDAVVAPFMTVATKVMGADQARQPSAGSLGVDGLPAVNGKGVGVAIIDSGIETTHHALNGKVAAAVSFVTDDPSTGDGFGHGTHIAGIIAGTETPATHVTPLYRGGIAPGAHLINVRVLGDNGAGYTSDVIAGLQWTLANRAKYGIRVVNMSLGHTQVEPCATDPLCLSVEQAVASGLVVVVSAGNSGKNSAGQEVLASITTPGVAPHALTVGALVTWGTVSTDDDTIASYSSRGPTRYELGLKPDVVAPGNKIVSLEAQGSYLAKKYPALHVAGSGKNAYMMMSGTSMAAAMVSGSAALLLEGTTLTARQVKMALQLSASLRPRDGVLRAGVGSVNVYSARRVNGAVRSLVGSIPPVTIAGQTLHPGGVMVQNGKPWIDSTTAPVGTGVVGSLGLLATWSDAIVTPARVTALKGAQMVWGDQIPAQQIVWGDQLPFGQQMVWGDLTPYGQQMVWGDSSLAQQMVWGDHTFGQQMVWGDQTLGQQMVWGDQTFGQQMVWGDADTSHANQMVWGDSVKPDRQ